MTEIMLRDATTAHGLRHVILRYFNVAGADPLGRTGQSTKAATHLIKVAAETALGLRPKMDVFGTDYPTRDGTCIRDYIHVSDLVAAHADALLYLRRGGASTTLNCGYGRGFSVLEVIETVKRVSGVDFKVEFAARRAGDPARLVAACDLVRSTLKWQPRFDDLRTIVNHALAGAQATKTAPWLRVRRPPLKQSLMLATSGAWTASASTRGWQDEPGPFAVAGLLALVLASGGHGTSSAPPQPLLQKPQLIPAQPELRNSMAEPIKRR